MYEKGSKQMQNRPMETTKSGLKRLHLFLSLIAEDKPQITHLHKRQTFNRLDVEYLTNFFYYLLYLIFFDRTIQWLYFFKCGILHETSNME